jgi:hypothetical protein
MSRQADPPAHAPPTIIERECSTHSTLTLDRRNNMIMLRRKDVIHFLKHFSKFCLLVHLRTEFSFQSCHQMPGSEKGERPNMSFIDSKENNYDWKICISTNALSCLLAWILYFIVLKNICCKIKKVKVMILLY